MPLVTFLIQSRHTTSIPKKTTPPQIVREFVWSLLITHPSIHDDSSPRLTQKLFTSPGISYQRTLYYFVTCSVISLRTDQEGQRRRRRKDIDDCYHQRDRIYPLRVDSATILSGTICVSLIYYRSFGASSHHHVSGLKAPLTDISTPHPPSPKLNV